MNYYGLANAIYGTNPTRMTTTIVAGREKDKMQVLDTVTNSLGTSRKYVEKAFRDLEAKTQEVVNLSSPEMKVPIVTGTETGLITQDPFRHMASIYRNVPVLVPTQQGGLKSISIKLSDLESRASSNQGIARMAEIGPGINPYELNCQCFNIGVCSIILAATDRNRLAMELPRGFDFADKMFAEYQVSLPIPIKGPHQIPGPVGESVLDLLTQWEQGDTNIQSEIIRRAKIWGEDAARSYLTRRLVGLEYRGSRFFGAPDEARGRLFLVPGAREAYGGSLMRGLDINYNICIKGNRDQRNPPYADVVACILADMIDKKQETKPGLVMIKSEQKN